MRREIPELAPDDPLAEQGDRLSAGQGVAIVVEAGQVIGTLSHTDLQRLTESIARASRSVAAGYVMREISNAHASLVTYHASRLTFHALTPRR